MTKKKENLNLISRPPIVVILGHVDHGKTTLLDTIRKTHVVARESGGITQHVGAYQAEYNGKLITFIDTPGHEAFSQMRSRGAKTADIAVLVIAGEEGVKPQTKEVVASIKKEEIPVIVAVNKMDNPRANFDKAVGELEKEGLIVEQRGGKVPAIKLSALVGTGVNDLLEMILLVAEMEELKADISKPATGVVVESYMDARRGATATFLVLGGVLEVGQWIACGNAYGKVKGLEDYKGDKIEKAEPSTPVIVMGLNEVPVVGSTFEVVEDEQSAVQKTTTKPAVNFNIQASAPNAEGVGGGKTLNVILKTDVHGSLEAIGESLAKLDLEEIGLKILKADVGNVSEADIKLAESTNSIIIAFRVKIANDIADMAKRKKIKTRSYDIIYELFEGIRKDAAKLLDPLAERENLGKLKILAIFKTEKTRMILGGKVIDGKFVNKTQVDIMRPASPKGGNEEKIGTGRIIQLQHNKKDMPEVEKGREAGLLMEGDAVVQEGDILECYRTEHKKREL